MKSARTNWWSMMTLPNPGNSSVKGLAQVLAHTAAEVSHIYPGTGRGDAAQTVVLLGDTVYSWQCMTDIFMYDWKQLTFVVSPDLSASAGEVWGLSWPLELNDYVNRMIAAALADHPPFAAYQPGQLRRIIKACDSLLPDVDCYDCVQINDYTRDIDIPAHVAMLPELAERARADDREHGVIW